MGTSIGVRYEGEKWALETVVGSRVQVLSEIFFYIFSTVIQFWQIWSTDLIAEKLEWTFTEFTEYMKSDKTLKPKLGQF